MLQFLLRRILAVLPVLFVVSLVVFLILRLAPGDPAAVIAGNSATNEDIAKIQVQLGLDRSIPVQYGIWMGNVFLCCLGFQSQDFRSLCLSLAICSFTCSPFAWNGCRCKVTNQSRGLRLQGLGHGCDN